MLLPYYFDYSYDEHGVVICPASMAAAISSQLKTAGWLYLTASTIFLMPVHCPCIYLQEYIVQYPSHVPYKHDSAGARN